MVEQLQTVFRSETIENPRKVFELKRTKARIGIGSEFEGKFPIFRVPLKTEDVRRIGNLLMTLQEHDFQSKVIKLSFEELETDCEFLIHLNEVQLINNVIHLGDKGAISWRHDGARGRVYLYMSVPREIQVRGVENSKT